MLWHLLHPGCNRAHSRQLVCEDSSGGQSSPAAPRCLLTGLCVWQGRSVTCLLLNLWDHLHVQPTLAVPSHRVSLRVDLEPNPLRELGSKKVTCQVHRRRKEREETQRKEQKSLLQKYLGIGFSWTSCRTLANLWTSCLQFLHL